MVKKPRILYRKKKYYVIDIESYVPGTDFEKYISSQLKPVRLKIKRDKS